MRTQSTSKDRVSREAAEEFLIQLYFGAGNDYLALCLRRAYLDFNRTLHGFASIKKSEQIRARAEEKLLTGIRALSDLTGDRAEFDAWHRSVCTAVRKVFRDARFPKFSFGQAQKWVNMGLKYAYVMGDRRVPGLERWYSHAHLPVDNIILESLSYLDLPPLAVAWSRLDDYGIYLDLQNRFRGAFKPRDLLEVEFSMWMEARKKLPNSKSTL